MAAGLSIGAYSYFPDAIEEHVGIVRLTRIMSPISASSEERPVVLSSRSFSPSSPLFVHTFSDPTGTHSQVGVENARRGSTPVVIASKNLVLPTQLTAATRSIGMPAMPAYASSPTGNASTRYALIVDVQLELKRVGCYQGSLDGSWGAGSKRAMQAFIRRINASLPIDEPDPILLALLKSHTAITCAAGCGPGQIENASGQCTPAAVFADTVSAPLDGAPRLVDAPRPIQRSVAVTTVFGWDARVRSGSDMYTLPDLIPVGEVRAALPGRMAVGALPAERQASAMGLVEDDYPPGSHQKSDERVMQTAAIPPEASPPAAAEPIERDTVRPAASAKKRHSSSTKRYRKEARQKQLMRQAFGEGF